MTGGGERKVVLVVELSVRSGTAEEARAHMRALRDASLQEPGCEEYSPCQVTGGDGRSFVFYERYSSQAAFEAHAASPHFERHAVNGLFKLAESRRRTLCEPV